MLLSELVRTSEVVAGAPGRKAKIDAIAALLRQAPPGEVPVAVAFLSGELRQRQIGVGFAAIRDLLGPAAVVGPDDPVTGPDGAAGPDGATAGPDGTAAGPDGTAAGPGPASAGLDGAAASLALADVDAAFAAIGAVTGPGTQAERRRLLSGVFSRATPAERSFLTRLLGGELHQGALEGVMSDAVARAAGVSPGDVRRAHLLGGSLPAVAEAALAAVAAAPDGSAAASAALRAFRLQVGRPLRPMLAASAPSVAAAFGRISPAAVEWKIDGVRIQVHRQGSQVRVFTRSLDDITARLPEITAAALDCAAESLVLDGEAIALGPDGRPRPFQVTASRAGTQGAPQAGRPDIPLTPFFFDVLHADGRDLIDEPASERQDRLAAVVPAGLRVPRIVTGDVTEAEAFFAGAVARGHEGAVVKSLDAPYAAGRRGSEWIKVKPRHTLDLVVLAAEWGHGRRRGWLSNLHLGARDPAGGFVMLGKTFKGLTDQMLGWQTAQLLALADPPGQPASDPGRGYGVLRVRPELVAEIAFDGVQTSPRYPGGLALRFARVLRYRPDKQAAEADTIDAVRAIWAGSGP
ncbi:MAG: ATP-dependent DNA ligase [Streptosporangiaceae bacterium]